MTWTVTNPGVAPHAAGRTLTSGEWSIAKEFYADGPTLHEYVVRRRIAGAVRLQVAGFNRLGDAKEWAERHDEACSCHICERWGTPS